MDALLQFYLLLAGAGLIQAGSMLVHAWEQRRFHARRFLRKCDPRQILRVALIAPCKGLDPDLRTNLQALFQQRYAAYELCFAVESEGDPAVQVIRELQASHPQISCRIVVAGRAQNCGQKVHNLMCATQAILGRRGFEECVAPRLATGERNATQAGEACGATDVLAFVDSDACPNGDWLPRLVDRIASGKYAVATGYRWYLPDTGAFASRLLSAINNTVIGLTGAHHFNLVWGGAWAIHVEAFRQLGLPAAWQGSLSDDLVVSRLVREAGLRVGYEPHCLVKSTADFNWPKLGEFLRRQYLVVRVYAPLWWRCAFLAGLLTNVCLWGSLGVSLYWAATGGPWAVPLAGGLAYYLAGVCRAQLSANAARPFLDVARADYDRVTRLSAWGWPLVALANWLGIVSAAFGRTIVWRGIGYRLDSLQKTTILESAVSPSRATSMDQPERSNANSDGAMCATFTAHENRPHKVRSRDRQSTGRE